MQTESAHSGKEMPLPPLSVHLEYCDQAFANARKRGAKLVRLSIAAPIAPLLSHPNGSMLWCPPSQTKTNSDHCPTRDAHLVGIGRMATITGTGPDRFSQLKAGANEIWSSLCDVPHPDAGADSPRLFGGLSFSEQPMGKEWDTFGHGNFWLPRTLYGRTTDHAWLSLCCNITESPHDVANMLFEELKRLAKASESTSKQAQIERTDHLNQQEWARRIESIRGAIAEGAVHKVVAARSSRLHFCEAIELRPALERLSERYPDCYRYAFALGNSTFLGASPETLIDKQGLNVSTQAIAGSIAADAPDAGNTLLASKKDRWEQQLVVQAITAALDPLCSNLTFESTPETLTLRHIMHLCTPISGKLQNGQHVLDIVQALHPTPAVGGSPAKPAMEWICAQEDDRGWYAAPVGWFDANGDGHFAVAIRSALFCGTEALVYVGAGIMQDSDPDLEYQETGLKQRAILDALGIF